MPSLRLRLAAAAVALLAALPASAALDVVLVLDNSGSMRRNDPSRLGAVAVEQFVNAQPLDARVGIVLFADAPELTVPLAEDAGSEGALERALRRLNYGGRLTQTAAAVERALYELRTEGRPGARKAIVLMTDGLIDTGDARRDAEMNAWLRKDLAAQAARDGIQVFGIAFTERADYQLLQSLASVTGADYFRVLDPQGLGKALERIQMALARTGGGPEAVAPAPAVPPAERAPAVPTEPAAPVAAPETGGPAWPWWLIAIAAGAVLAGLAWWRRADLVAVLARRRAPAHAEPDGPLAVLLDLSDPKHVKRREIGRRPVVIGRSQGTDPSRDYIVLSEKTIGRWHATVERRGQSFWIRDEASVNGTFVNDERITGEVPLKTGDKVRVHNHEFQFVIPDLANLDRTMIRSALPTHS